MSIDARRVFPAVLAPAAVSGSTIWLSTGDAQPALTPSAVYLELGTSDAVGIGATRPETEGWVLAVHAGLHNGTHAPLPRGIPLHYS